MRLPAALVGAVLVALSASNATAVVRITDDVGGRIGTYVEAYSAVRSSGERVVIEGQSQLRDGARVQVRDGEARGERAEAGSRPGTAP